MFALALLAVAAGVANHVLYFNRGEHHLWATTYLQVFASSFIGALVALVQLKEYSISAASLLTSIVAASYLLGTYASLIIYRVYLSPLNEFPGPWQAKISDLWLLSRLTQFNTYYKFEELHKKYGKYVRIGSNTLSISDADFHDLAFSQNSTFRKSQWYDGSKPFDSMHTTRDKALHDRRRRIWAPAFSDKALREYEPKVQTFNDKLIERIREHRSGPMDMSKWFNLYSFDVMGQLAFGRDYGMLDSGERHWALDLLTKGMESAPPRIPIWAFRILLSIPFAAGGFFKFLKFCKSELEWRIKNKGTEGDITGWLLKAYKDVKEPAEDPLFQGDSRLIIVAGSDTTTATMTYLFYELAKKPEEVKKLRKELLPLAKGDWTDVDVRNAPHLNGTINESLRLHPPVPSGLQRGTPKEGAKVGDVFVPGDVEFWMPQFVLGRDEDNYEQALDFVPERWYSKPDMVKHKNAFAPFSLGSDNCIGKNLAFMQMRTLLTQLVTEFDVAFAPGEDGSSLLYKTKDHFTLSLGSLHLILSPASS